MGQMLAVNKWLRRVIGLLLVVLLVWASAWLLLPSWLKGQLETRLGEQLGRQVTLGRMAFKPWSLELDLHDLRVARAPGAVGGDEAPQFSVKHIYIDAELQSLLRLAPVIDAITVEAPTLNLSYLGEGRYDVDDILARLSGQPAQPGSEPLRFALYNLALTGGRLTFHDVARQQTHELTHLQLSLPFLSNLPSQREVRVTPKLAFQLNGSQFDATAQSTPFAPGRQTEASLQLTGLDLAPYLSYQPAGLPLHLASGLLALDLKVNFEQQSQAAVTLSGELSARDVKFVSPGLSATREPVELASFEQLTVQLTRLQPLLQKVELGQMTLVKPRVLVQRARSGQLNWLTLLQPDATSKNAGLTQPKPASPGEGAATPAPAGGWKVALAQWVVQGGEVQWLDASTPSPSRLTLSAVDLRASELAWPLTEPVAFEGQAQLDAAALSFKGSANDQRAELTARVQDLPLSVAAPYVAQVLQPRLDGVMNADLALSWQAAGADRSASRLQLQLPQLTLYRLALVQAKGGRRLQQTLASIRQLQLQQVSVDVLRRSVSLGRLSVMQPQLRVLRTENGRWMVEDWLKTASVQGPRPSATSRTSPLPGSRTPIAGAASAPAWALKLAQFDLRNGSLTFVDQAVGKPVNLELSAVSLQLSQFASPAGGPFGLQLAARVRHGRTEPGQFQWRGTGHLTPMQLQGQLTLQRLPLHALEPYLSEVLNVELLRADGSFQGKLKLVQQVGGVRLHLQGDVGVEDFQANTLAQAEPFVPAEELLRWDALSLRGIDLALAPGVATRLAVQETVLSDFYARLVLSQAGRLNLQDLLKPDSPATHAAAPTGEAAPPASAPAAGQDSAVRPADPHAKLAPVVHFGPVSVLGGQVDFSDRFIQPNYSARLTELIGKLSAFSSQSDSGEVQLADLELRGRAEGSATLQVLGKVNPLARPLALDIQGQVRDLELPPLSPYAARYAGYGIERGKLSVDVAYKVMPDGQLSADNKIVLNQLRFGDEVPGAQQSLPVKLAVALLADRHGVIDINLPVSGSLNDPDFRIGPIVFKLIVNLVVKAVTAPFSLLANLLGGAGDELSQVAFAPGTASLSAEARAGLDKVAKALTDRPALKLTVVGTASLAQEREAFKRARLQSLVLAEKRREAALDTASDQAGQPLQVTAEEYPALLKSVYKRADFPKPRNLIGLTKDIPVPEMEALLLANLSVTEAAIQELALQRGVVVRDYLAALNLPSDRLFLGAAKALAPDAKWQPSAELQLSTQ